MKPILILGTTIVNLALISYTLFIYNERKHKKLNKLTLSFLTIGVSLDIIATICMVIGSSKGAFTLHGLLGYSSLTGMFIDFIMLWRNKIKNGLNSSINYKVHVYSNIAYIWWIISYISGALIVMAR
jgi:hypothetical protein